MTIRRIAKLHGTCRLFDYHAHRLSHCMRFVYIFSELIDCPNDWSESKATRATISHRFGLMMIQLTDIRNINRQIKVTAIGNCTSKQTYVNCTEPRCCNVQCGSNKIIHISAIAERTQQNSSFGIQHSKFLVQIRILWSDFLVNRLTRSIVCAASEQSSEQSSELIFRRSHRAKVHRNRKPNNQYVLRLRIRLLLWLRLWLLRMRSVLRWLLWLVVLIQHHESDGVGGTLQMRCRVGGLMRK